MELTQTDREFETLIETLAPTIFKEILQCEKNYSVMDYLACRMRIERNIGTINNRRVVAIISEKNDQRF